MSFLRRIALVTLLAIPLAGQHKPPEPKPLRVRAASPVLPAPPHVEKPAPNLEKRRERMRGRDREIDRMLKAKPQR